MGIYKVVEIVVFNKITTFGYELNTSYA